MMHETRAPRGFMQNDVWRLRAFDAVFSFAIFAGLANFGWHAFQGDRGVLALIQIDAEERALRGELEALQGERLQMENLTRRLSERWLDGDLLDERARAMLGHMRADEVTPR
jgi:cell division protein FtsB